MKNQEREKKMKFRIQLLILARYYKNLTSKIEEVIFLAHITSEIFFNIFYRNLQIVPTLKKKTNYIIDIKKF